MAKTAFKPLPHDWRDRATVDLHQSAEVLGIGRSTAYQAAARGEIEVLKFGKRMVVPTLWLRRKLGEVA